MDAHHDIPIALLQGHWKRADLIHMNCVQQFSHHYKDVIVIVDGWRRWGLCAQFYFNHYWCSNLCQADSFLLPLYVSFLCFVHF